MLKKNLFWSPRFCQWFVNTISDFSYSPKKTKTGAFGTITLPLEAPNDFKQHILYDSTPCQIMFCALSCSQQTIFVHFLPQLYFIINRPNFLNWLLYHLPRKLSALMLITRNITRPLWMFELKMAFLDIFFPLCISKTGCLIKHTSLPVIFSEHMLKLAALLTMVGV